MTQTERGLEKVNNARNLWSEKRKEKDELKNQKENIG
jgi:hypothetical protein